MTMTETTAVTVRTEHQEVEIQVPLGVSYEWSEISPRVLLVSYSDTYTADIYTDGKLYTEQPVEYSAINGTILQAIKDTPLTTVVQNPMFSEIFLGSWVERFFSKCDVLLAPSTIGWGITAVYHYNGIDASIQTRSERGKGHANKRQELPGKTVVYVIRDTIR